MDFEIRNFLFLELLTNENISHRMEKIFAVHLSATGHIFKIYKEPLYFNKNLIFLMAKDFNGP